MKTICLFGISNSGKTTTLGMFARKIYDHKNSKIISGCLPEKADGHEASKDFKVIIEFKGLKIGIGSAGDHAASVKENLNYIKNNKCDFAIVATRSKGETPAVLKDVCGVQNILWLRQRKIKVGAKYQVKDFTQLINQSNEQTVELLMSIIKSSS